MADDVRNCNEDSKDCLNDSNVTTHVGTLTTQSAQVICGCPEPGPETIEVEQVLGAQMAQRVVEFDMTVPSQKPDIEQVIDVYVKDLCIRCIDVLPNKVIIRGDFAVKVMYVADLPSQPVHAFEKRQVRFTRDVVIEGATKDMKANADVQIEFVNYDFNEDFPRTVHITVVLRFWARVLTTTEMDVYALTPLAEVGDYGEPAMHAAMTSEDVVSASQLGGGDFAGVGAQNILVTGPGIPTTAGVVSTANGTATVTGTKVNVRTGPGTNFPVVVQVDKGAVVTIKDQAFGWYKVVLSDGSTTGWIASWLLEVAGTTGTTPNG